MPRLLAIDIGSSSTKAAIIANGRIKGSIERAPFATHFIGDRVEVPAQRILKSITDAVGKLDRTRVDCVAISSMGPSWIALDSRGRAITPVVTHQDRRSIQQGRQIERQIGKARHLSIAGARPIPGGISSTTNRWFVENAATVMRRAALIGHLPTLLLHRWCGVRVIDPSHASFTGMYRTISLGGWCDELVSAARAKRNQLPEIVAANEIAGTLGRSGAGELGLPIGTPVLPGILDGSVPMLFAGARAGRVVNVCGSTDVLAVCVDNPKPHERLLTRALGVGKLWLTVGTIAAAGSSIDWARRVMFADHDDVAFANLLARIIRLGGDSLDVRFIPGLGGDRTNIEPVSASFENLNLSTGRENMLRAVLVSLRQQSTDRMKLFKMLGVPMSREVTVAGGADDAFTRLMTRAWPGKWCFRRVQTATLAGLARLVG